jgi:hypothetical protein
VVDFADLGSPAVMLCYAQATQDEAEPIESAIRRRYPDATSLIVAHVIDLHTVPGLFRGVAEGIMEGEFDKAARELPEGELPYNHVLVLPDWDGAFVGAVAFADDVSKHLGVAVFTSDGKLAGTAQGAGITEATLAMLSDISG